jgi:hypothetical protein
MNYQSKKVVGVWMDHHHAFVISTPDQHAEGEYDVVKKIARHEHDSSNYKNEKVDLAKGSQEQKKYFKAISDQINHAEAIYIFGPGTAQEEFKNTLGHDHHYNGKEILLGTSDKITDNQMIAQVRDHFHGK